MYNGKKSDLLCHLLNLVLGGSPEHYNCPSAQKKLRFSHMWEIGTVSHDERGLDLLAIVIGGGL